MRVMDDSETPQEDGGDKQGAEEARKEPAKEEPGERDRFVPAEQRSAVDSTRRSDETRRHEQEDFEGEEKRHEPDRRVDPDRRGMTFDVNCKTSGSISTIEDWLDQHCKGEWNLILAARTGDLTQKSIRIMFELSEDKEQFINLYGKTKE